MLVRILFKISYENAIHSRIGLGRDRKRVRILELASAKSHVNDDAKRPGQDENSDAT